MIIRDLIDASLKSLKHQRRDRVLGGLTFAVVAMSNVEHASASLPKIARRRSSPIGIRLLSEYFRRPIRPSLLLFFLFLFLLSEDRLPIVILRHFMAPEYDNTFTRKTLSGWMVLAAIQ